MIIQRSFKGGYVDLLRQKVMSGESISSYSEEKFPIEEEQVVLLPGIEHPNKLIDKMMPNTSNDFQSAIALYEAYPLTPIQASDDNLWIYLAHTELFAYVQKRFPKVLETDFFGANYIIDHWFSRNKYEGNILKRHWWSVHLSIDDDLDDKYKYTKIIFSDYAARTYHFTSSKIARHKEAAIGILKFFYDNKDVAEKCFRGRLLYVTKYFNRMGGVRNLAALDRDFFYSELVKLRPKILAIIREEDAR